jgi:dihydrofolate synthase/folylpolyglutamate synthase
MTYEQAIDFWYGRINYEQQSPHPRDLKLDRMRALLALLGNPQERLRILHVAGSKGKGSTSAMLASILRQAGYRIGLFTSPHLCRVEERVQVDGTPITRDELTALLTDLRPVVEGLDASRKSGTGGITFFEVATAVGLLHFVRRRVETAVIEVGLGGRFDSTNVCRPLVAVITSISFDHTQQLGKTLGRIAMEKAGIVKSGRPVVSGVRTLEAREVIERICRERGAPLRQLGVDFHYRYEPGRITATGHQASRVAVRSGRRQGPVMELALVGEHQAANAAVAVAVVEDLRRQGLIVPDAAVAAGLASVRWPARLEIMAGRPLVLLDCAHNVASAEALVETLQTSLTPPAGDGDTPAPRRHLLFAGSSDKDLAGMLRVLTPHFSDLYLTKFANSPRAVPPDVLAEIARQTANVPATVWPSAAAAWRAARAAAGPADLICITGSVFLAGELWALVKADAACGLARLMQFTQPGRGPKV